MGKKTASQIGKLSRRKGKSFEREMARLFTKATGIKWETTRNSGRTDLRGDIYAPDLGEPFIVECKHRKEYELHQMMSNTKSLRDVVKKAEGENKPFVILVKNSSGVWFYTGCFLTFDYYNRCGRNFYNGENSWYELKNLKLFSAYDFLLKFNTKVMLNYGKNKQA